MKRSGPLRRKTPLSQGDKPLKRSALVRKSPMRRAPGALEAAEGVPGGIHRPARPATGDGLKRGPVRKVGSDAKLAAAWRAAALARSPVCERCGTAWPLEIHHAIEAQFLRRWAKAEAAVTGDDSDAHARRLLYDDRNAIVWCQRCHERHTSWTARLPRDQLPERVWDFAMALGDRAVIECERSYPEDPAAGRAAT